MRCRSVRIPAGGQTAPGPGRTALDVDLQSVQVAEVEDDPALGRAVAGDAVAAASNRKLEAGLPCERDDPRDVERVGGPDDRRRPAVDSSIENGPSIVVAGISRGYDTSCEVCLQLRD